MADREKVIREWENVLSSDPSDATWNLIDDTLALLMAKKPLKKSDMYFCADCKTSLPGTHNYCHKCGRAVKWE